MFESSFSGSKFNLVQKSGECGVEAMEGALRTSRSLRRERGRRAEGPRIEPCVEHRHLRAGRGDAIPVASRYALDEAVQTKTPKVVGHRASRIGIRIATLQLCDVIAKLPMPEADGRKREETEGVHERVHAAVAETKASGPLIVKEDEQRDGVEAVFADQAVVVERFDAQEAPVGSKADRPQGGQIAKRTTDVEVVGIVDGGFRAKGSAFFVVLLDLGLLVLDMERRHNERPRSRFSRMTSSKKQRPVSGRSRT